MGLPGSAPTAIGDKDVPQGVYELEAYPTLQPRGYFVLLCAHLSILKGAACQRVHGDRRQSRPTETGRLSRD